MTDRLTMTSDKGGVAFTFDLDIACEKSEIVKILKVAEKLKAYEEIGTVEEFREARERQRTKKPRFYAHNYYCGNCGNLVGNSEFNWKRFMYCDRCGNPVDWSE